MILSLVAALSVMSAAMNPGLQSNVKLPNTAPLFEALFSEQSPEQIPLSFAQQRLWFVDQLEPKSAVYNVPSAVRISGFLNITALKGSIEAIVERHEVLRTVYLSVDGAPVQQVFERANVELPLVDLSDLPEVEKENELLRLLTEEAGRPFSLSSDLMLRSVLFRLSVKEHVLFVNIHHIACDEWSMGIFFRELAAFYQSFCDKKPVSLRELPVQYADFALWQRDWLRGDVLAKQLGYWRKQLGGELPVLELPVDRPRPITPTHSGGRVTRTLSSGVTNGLKALCRRENVSPFMLMMASLKTLLHRYTGQEDIIIGTPIAGRNRVETEGLIGFFVNTLTLRTSFLSTHTFREVLQRVRETALAAFSFQDLPFEKLVEEVQPERTAAQTPLFNVMFAYQNAPEPIVIPGLTLTPIEVENHTAKFDLTIVAQDSSEGLVVHLEYNRDVFDAATAERMLGHLETLLEAVANNPDQPIATIPLLTANERKVTLDEWNRTWAEYPAKTPVHQLFEAQAERTPHSIAVTFGNEAISYRELNIRANQLANFLRKNGVGPDVLVGICVERSVQMIVGWLGILKAGGAYVPLDPSYPADRLEFMFSDTKMPVLLTEKKFLASLPKETKKICLDSDWKQIAREETRTPVSGVTADDLAYVIYTSGSTGKPKGVAVRHCGIARLVCNTNYISIQPTDVFAQASNASFDAATFEVWGALLHGAKVVGVPQSVLLSPHDLAADLRNKRITTFFVTTALFNQIAAAVPDAFRTLRCVLFGGEACDPKAVKSIMVHGPPARLLHVYGPTETTTFASFYEVKGIPDGVASLPIGRPISNTTFFVLDKNLQPVPVGVPGELYIGGDGVARGYWKRPELTSQRFISMPATSGAGGILYKTGDRVKFLPDGNVEFLGRVDNQVKIRGYRIELEEIELALEQHPGVSDAVVLARESGVSKELVAYIAHENKKHPSSEELRRLLKQKLPEFMVPAVFIFLEKFPLTPNGKVDRRALPSPESADTSTSNCVLPRNNLENQLAKIWEQVLQRKPIGVRDNFFELGGHSLLAVKLFGQIEKVMGPKLSLSTLFQAPTIEELANIISRKKWSSPGASLVEIQPHGSNPPFFWLHTLGGGGGGGLFVYRRLAELLGPNQPSYGLVTPPEPFAQIEAMAAHYISEMRTLQPNGPYYVGGYCFGGVIAYEIARQLEEQGAKVAMLALIESVPPNCERRGFNAELIWHFAKTLPTWIGYTAALGPRHLIRHSWQRVGRLLRMAARTNALAKKGDEKALVREQISQVFDFDNYPEDYKQYAESHWLALRQYRPKPFSGRATLFRTQRPRLLNLNAEKVWAKLIPQGLEVRYVPGTHEQILEEPFVKCLAKELKESLGCSAVAIPEVPAAKAA